MRAAVPLAIGIALVLAVVAKVPSEGALGPANRAWPAVAPTATLTVVEWVVATARAAPPSPTPTPWPTPVPLERRLFGDMPGATGLVSRLFAHPTATPRGTRFVECSVAAFATERQATEALALVAERILLEGEFGEFADARPVRVEPVGDEVRALIGTFPSGFPEREVTIGYAVVLVRDGHFVHFLLGMGREAEPLPELLGIAGSVLARDLPAEAPLRDRLAQSFDMPGGFYLITETEHDLGA